MGILDLLNQWKNSQCIIEMHYIHAGHKKVAHGRVYSFDAERQTILFYDEDKKSVENISLTQIEDALSAETKRTEADVGESVRPEDGSKKRQEQQEQEHAEPSVGQTDKHNPESTAGKESGPKELPIKEELLLLIDRLPIDDLNALYPIVRHLAKRQETKAKGAN
ncbi:hypothetical protein [Paenibacillus sp. GYB003]|uniref:hypothetical protein n=1 Tax=Paenibacillus sp. GYB003 TaxID=2994392 RepID=UPI002F96803B